VNVRCWATNAAHGRSAAATSDEWKKTRPRANVAVFHF